MTSTSRSVTLSLLGFVAAISLSACAGGLTSSTSVGLPGGPLNTAGTTLEKTQGSAESTYTSQTGQLGLFSLEASKIAARKTGNLAVRAFADSEIEEQTTMANLLARLAPNQPKPALTNEQQAMLSKLSAAGGDMLIRDYINGQVTGHQQLLAVQESYLGTGAFTPQTITAQLARGRILDHIKLLKAFRSGAMR